jgi:hypothetical protein
VGQRPALPTDGLLIVSLRIVAATLSLLRGDRIDVGPAHAIALEGVGPEQKLSPAQPLWKAQGD